VPSDEEKSTVPVGTVPGWLGLTFAVKVTSCVTRLGDWEELTETVAVVRPTVSGKGGDFDRGPFDPRKLESPTYVAVME
jgi:hypothetical protein